MTYNAFVTILHSHDYAHYPQDEVILIGKHDKYGFLNLMCSVNIKGKSGGVILHQPIVDEFLLSLVNMYITTPKQDRF